ncbi:hypothetical protein, partial [Nostoc sp. CHAB 5715]|uniref:hypothetical protein n=1 Tax=Nostoc sp. CHAB 5715 TaxID=2780400 RepID=UPI001E4140C8
MRQGLNLPELEEQIRQINTNTQSLREYVDFSHLRQALNLSELEEQTRQINKNIKLLQESQGY